jgi:hypothetical protein
MNNPYRNETNTRNATSNATSTTRLSCDRKKHDTYWKQRQFMIRRISSLLLPFKEIGIVSLFQRQLQLLVLLTLLGSWKNNYMNMNILLVNGESGLDGKDIPEKGDSKCPSLADRYTYFQNATHQNEDTADVWLLPCEETGTYTNTNNGSPEPILNVQDLPSHAIVLSIYAALPAYADDFRTFILVHIPFCFFLSWNLTHIQAVLVTCFYF